MIDDSALYQSAIIGAGIQDGQALGFTTDFALSTLLSSWRYVCINRRTKLTAITDGFASRVVVFYRRIFFCVLPDIFTPNDIR